MSNFKDVGTFHKKFDFPTAAGRQPAAISRDVSLFRLGFLMEEMTELFKGYGLDLDWTTRIRADQRQDLPEIADALVDLVYVALGTAQHHALPWQELWNEVQRANMDKERVTSAMESKRGHALDCRKPVDWKAPAIAEVLLRHGWNGPELPFNGDSE